MIAIFVAISRNIFRQFLWPDTHFWHLRVVQNLKL